MGFRFVDPDEGEQISRRHLNAAVCAVLGQEFRGTINNKEHVDHIEELKAGLEIDPRTGRIISAITRGQ